MNSLFESEFNLISFAAGIVLAWVWQRVKCAYKSHKLGRKVHPPKWNPVLIAVAVAIVGFLYISAQSSENTSALRDLARNTAECQKQFNEALRVRGAITQDNDRLSQIQREALAGWIHDLIFPPAPYNSMEPDDPRRKAWIVLRTQEADKVISEAQEEQRRNDIERALPENQYPEPTCGQEVPE